MPKQAQLPALTGLRFVAALLVVVHHVMRHFRPGIVPTDAQDPVIAVLERLLYALLYEGGIAVDFFFVLSGFILTYNYVNQAGDQRVSGPGFYIARIARIYPAYIFSLFIAAGPFLWQNAQLSLLGQCRILFLNLTMTQSWTTSAYTWNDPAWSLSVEAFFYVSFPFLALYIGRLMPSHFPHALVACWLAICIAPLLCLAIGRTGLVSQGIALNTLFVNPVVRLPEFVFGMLLGRWFVLSGGVRELDRIFTTGIALIVCVVGLIIVFSYPALEYVPGLLAPCWGLLLLSATSTRGRTRIWRARLVVLLGEASYSLYLLHWPLWDWLTLLLGRPRVAPGSPVGWLLVLGYLALLIIASLGSYRYIEKPARQAIRSFSSTVVGRVGGARTRRAS